ncbi:MAG TPA: hypothetical protein VGQ33_04595 [Vicinamibacteria bacterium]|nr:hypothetical protein [Vicinamibacteria bacterium]
MFGGWSWRSRDPGSRPAGLGGAYVAVADSIRTAAINPAGIALVPKAELSVGTSALWAGIGISLRHTAPSTPAGPAAPPPVTTRPTQPGRPVPCAPPRQTRPLALALFVEQSVTQDNQLDVVRGPSLSESGTLSSTTETAGLTVARGLTPWLDLGATVTWRHVQMEGQSSLVDLAGDELSRITIGGDANKARAIAGALATFGPLTDPTAFRLGVAYQRDIVGWSVERTAIDRVRGVVNGPSPIDLEEPPVLTGGAAWRVSDTWLVSGEVDYIWYDRIGRALARDTDSATASAFTLKNGVEPRLGVEMTASSLLGGEFKLRAGVRRETSGRLAYVGSDTGLQQAFAAAPAAVRAGAGASLLGEFYENAFRLDVDVSQVVVQHLTPVRAAGRRRISLALTVRL